MPSVVVTLHRVGTDAKAPIDSMRTTANGTYDFKYKTSGAELYATYRNAAVAGFIDVKELALVQRNIGEATARAIPPLIGAFIGYFVLGVGTAYLFARLDRHYRVKR